MKMWIDPEKEISQIQYEFNQAYPFLKLEFLKNLNGNGVRFPDGIHSSMRVRELTTGLRAREISLRESMSVADVEQLFHDLLGISVLVYRRSGNIWLETTMTNHWSLKQQNEHGREITMGSA